MKSEKGITLTILIIYIVVFTIVIALLASLSNYIYSNLKYVNEHSVDVSEFNKFNAYFIKNVKANKDAEVKTNTNGIQITFVDGDTYQYVNKDKSIYKNKQKIAENIKSFTAEKKLNEDNKKKYIEITIGIGEEGQKNYTKTINYVLKYWDSNDTQKINTIG